MSRVFRITNVFRRRICRISNTNMTRRYLQTRVFANYGMIPINRASILSISRRPFSNDPDWKHSRFQHAVSHPTQEFVAEERPTSRKYSGKEFDNFLARKDHLFDFIYHGLKPLYETNKAIFEMEHKSKAVNDPNLFTIKISLVGDYVLSFDSDNETVGLWDPLAHHTYHYKYDSAKDDWVDVSHPDQRLLVRLYTELDGHLEGYPHFGIEDEFHH